MPSARVAAYQAVSARGDDGLCAAGTTPASRFLRETTATLSINMFIHATTPPGMETMKRLKRAISYRYETRPRGAQVHLSTQNPQAIAAIHKFLRFQTQEHQTGDPLTVHN